MTWRQETDPEALFSLGEALQETNEEKARERFAQAAELQRALVLANPGHAPHHARLGDMLEAAGQEGAWQAWYDAALLDPELPNVHDALCCDQDGEIEVAFLKAVRQLKAADWTGALAAFQRIVDERPVHSGALCGLGMAASQLGLATAAEQAFQRASALWPDWDRPRRALAALATQRLTPPENTS